MSYPDSLMACIYASEVRWSQSDRTISSAFSSARLMALTSAGLSEINENGESRFEDGLSAP